MILLTVNNIKCGEQLIQKNRVVGCLTALPISSNPPRDSSIPTRV